MAIESKDNIVFPQPFNPSIQQNLRIPYPFSDEDHASLMVMGISGRLINVINGSSKIIQYINGKYFLWDGRDKAGQRVPSGVYVYVLTDGTNRVVGKIAVVRN